MENLRGTNRQDTIRISRRHLLGATTAGLAAFTIVPRHVLGGVSYIPPSEKLNIAGVGVGGQGGGDINQVSGENIVALCDVDHSYAAGAMKKYPKAKKYYDFRKMLEKEKNIDAIVVGTPDHTHAIVSMMAIKMGKHVYCEKPLTRTVYEARALAKAARQAGVATQMGNQGMAFEGNRLINEWIADGAIGNVYEVHAWSDRPAHFGKILWPQGIDRPKETPAIPTGLDWDLWLGPAMHRPYHPAYHPFRWRGWWDFGSGGLGDMGIHNLAPVFSALNLDAPLSVNASSTLFNDETLPLASTIHFQFGPRGDRGAVKLHWYDGGILPPRPDELDPGRNLDPEDGVIFVGDKGKLYVEGWGGNSPRLIPEKRMKEYKRPPKTLPRSIGHHAEWIKACKEGTPTRSDFNFAGPLTEAVLLGTVSVRMGGKELHWDSKNLKVTNLADANKYIHYKYRDGWTL